MILVEISWLVVYFCKGSLKVFLHMILKLTFVYE